MTGRGSKCLRLSYGHHRLAPVSEARIFSATRRRATEGSQDYWDEHVAKRTRTTPTYNNDTTIKPTPT